ncbi:hypothetical protein JD844_018251, partial [Phrynosoma platyrhinos]
VFLLKVGHEPLPPTVGRNLLGSKVLYLPGFFTYARHIVEVDGKKGLFRGLSPRILSSTLSTVSRGQVKKKSLSNSSGVIANLSDASQSRLVLCLFAFFFISQAFPLEDMEHVSNKDDVKTSLRKVAKETSHEMMMQCVSRVISHPLHVISMRCMVQFIGREIKYRGVFSSIVTIWKEEGLWGFFVYGLPKDWRIQKLEEQRFKRGLVPHILGDVIFLWCCNLLAHLINTYAVDDNFSQASVIRSYTKFVMGVTCWPPSICSYIFLLDSLLETPQFSGTAFQRLQPAFS